MGIALGGAHRQSGRRGDLRERRIEGVLQGDDLRLRGRQFREAAAELASRFGRGERTYGVALVSFARVFEQQLRAPRMACLGDVLARVRNEPMEPCGELRLTAELSDANDELCQRVLGGIACVFGVAQQVRGEPFDARRVARDERVECTAVSVLRASDQDGVGEDLVDEEGVAPNTMLDWEALAPAGLHDRPTLVRVQLDAATVLPHLRGAFGREYHHAQETPTTQRMLPPDASHGAVAVAEHQTEGRGRLGRVWIDEPGRNLAFSVVLRAPLPIARWPELTVVAARAVAAAIGPEAQVKHPNDVLVNGRKVAGILAEASERVVLGIGVNVGACPWPGAGFVACDRLDLLVDVLVRLEQGYDAWLATLPGD